jgi:glutathione S-transferase
VTYVLYWCPDNANLIVRMALEELAAPYRAVPVDRAAGELRGAAYLTKNPQGLLPVLVDPEQDAPLFETGAILLHLADRHGRLLPEGAGRGRCLKWLFFLSNTLHADLRCMFHSDRYVADPAAIPALRGALRGRIARHFALLDAEIGRSGGPWLLGDEPTICDIYLAVCARWAVLYPVGHAVPADTIASNTRLAALLRALEQRPAIRRACEQEGIFGSGLSNPAQAAA